MKRGRGHLIYRIRKVGLVRAGRPRDLGVTGRGLGRGSSGLDRLKAGIVFLRGKDSVVAQTLQRSDLSLIRRTEGLLLAAGDTRADHHHQPEAGQHRDFALHSDRYCSMIRALGQRALSSCCRRAMSLPAPEGISTFCWMGMTGFPP